jgi:ParB family chromosome partitioning protein
VPVIVRELSDAEAAEFALIENVQRTDLNPIEEATGYSELIERFGYTQEQVADAVGKSRSHLANTLRLLRLPASVQALLQDGRLTSGHARALIGRGDAEALASASSRRTSTYARWRPVQDEARGGGRREVGATGGDDKDADAAPSRRTCQIRWAQGESSPAPASGTLSIRYGNLTSSTTSAPASSARPSGSCVRNSRQGISGPVASGIGLRVPLLASHSGRDDRLPCNAQEPTHDPGCAATTGGAH